MKKVIYTNDNMIYVEFKDYSINTFDDIDKCIMKIYAGGEVPSDLISQIDDEDLSSILDELENDTDSMSRSNKFFIKEERTLILTVIYEDPEINTFKIMGQNNDGYMIKNLANNNISFCDNYCKVDIYEI